MAIQQEYEAAKKANEERYAQAMSIYDEIISRYRPGGTFQKAGLGELEKRKTRDIGAETQSLISSGMFGTTTVGGLPRKWEAGVGAGERLRLEDIMMQRLSQAQVGKAGFMERKEDVYPDVGAYAGYAGQEVAARTSTRTMDKGPSPWEAGFMGGGWSLGGGTGTPAAGGTGGAVYGSGTKEATMAAREKAAQAAATVSPSTRALAGATTYGQAQAAVGGQPPTGSLPGQTANVWKRGDYAEWLRVKGVTNSSEAQKAFQAAKGTPK